MTSFCLRSYFNFHLFFFFQFDQEEQADIEFRMPNRYSQSYDDSTLDSPTVRSFVSTQPVVDDHVVVADYANEVRMANAKESKEVFVTFVVIALLQKLWLTEMKFV